MKPTLTLITTLLLTLAIPAIRGVAQVPNAHEVKGVETSPGLTILGRYVAVDNVCAWPSLTFLPDGTIAAIIYGHPSHLQGPGDVQCWTSRDGRGLWEFRGTVAPHGADSTRGNVAAGLAHNGDLVVLAGGWAGPPNYRKHRIPPCVSRSADGGKTWTVDESETAVVFPPEIRRDDYQRMLVPFGSIVRMTEKKLAASFYDDKGKVFALFSEDDGWTWGHAVEMAGEHGDEIAMLRLRPDRWLAVMRANSGGPDPKAWLRGMRQLVSSDEGRTWIPGDLITGHNEHPGHLLRLADGRVLVTFGMRNASSVGIRISPDEGRTWESPRVLVTMPSWKGLVFDPPPREHDLGYPSTVQLADGSFVTAWYSIGTEQHTRYHMGTVLWKMK